jgi:TPR repeat protein
MEALAKESAMQLKDPASAAKVAARVPAHRAWEKQGRKDLREALRLYDEALRLDPGAARVRCERSWVLSQAGDHARAYADAKQGLLDGRDDTYCMHRALAVVPQLQDKEQVIALTTLVIEVDATLPQAFNQRGWAAEQLGRRDAALRDYLAGAKLGDAWAQARVGRAYLEGFGVERDDAEGAAWLRKSAAQGNADAKRLLEARRL